MPQAVTTEDMRAHQGLAQPDRTASEAVRWVVTAPTTALPQLTAGQVVWATTLPISAAVPLAVTPVAVADTVAAVDSAAAVAVVVVADSAVAAVVAVVAAVM